LEIRQGKEVIVKAMKWKDIAVHGSGCPYKGVALYETEEDRAKYHSGYCPGCNCSVKWEEIEQVKENAASKA